MVRDEQIKQLFRELKECPTAETGKRFSSISDIFSLLSKAKRNEGTRDFYKWAKKSSATQSLKYCYAKFLLAHNYFLNEQHEAALYLAVDAQKLFENLNNREGIALSAALMGGIYRTLGNFELALKTLWESYAILKQSGVHPHFMLACTCNMGNIYLEMQNYDEALQMFKIMYEQCEKTDDHFWTGYALHGLGKVYMLKNEYAEAEKNLEKARLIAEQQQNYPAVSNAITELANFYFQCEDLVQAEKLNQEALIIRYEHHLIGGAVTNCIRLGGIYMKQSKPDEALEILGKGLEMAEQIKVKPKIYQINLLLSKIYECKNETEQSLFCFKRYHEVREMVEKEDNARKLKNAHLIFEAEQTQKENTVIKKQKVEIERKNTELQETIDNLTRAKIGKKAKAFTLAIAIISFILEDFILHTVLNVLPGNNYYLSLIVKMIIIFSLNPINKAIENYLLKKVIRNKKQGKEVIEIETGHSLPPEQGLLSYS